MISKPLLKQSIKANGFLWLFVTLTTCAILAIVIIMLGSLSLNHMKDSMMNLVVTSQVDSTIKQQSMNYYNMTENSISKYVQSEDSLKDLLQVQLNDTTKTTIIGGYNALIENGLSDSEARAELLQGFSPEMVLAVNTLLDYYLIQGEDYSDEKISEYVLNQILDGVYNQALETSGEEIALSVKQFLQNAIDNYLPSENLDISEFVTEYIPPIMQDMIYGSTFDYEGETINISEYFTENEISEISYNAITSFRVNLIIKENQIRQELQLEEYYADLTSTEIEEIVSERLQTFVSSIITNLSAGLWDSLPDGAVESLSEMANVDIYELVVGSIFFKIAGILLPLIYTIMVANNLIAGQVDAGSMAFILSTPTKRKTVTLTQMTFLAGSLFLMFFLTTVVSVSCLAILNSGTIGLTITQLLLLNLGLFITMFAISGICFLASSWFNRSKHSMGIGGGLSIFFLVATILGLVGSSVLPPAMSIEAMNYFNYFSIITLFDTSSILNGTTVYLWKFGILLLIGIITYVISIIKFNKKDLPL